MLCRALSCGRLEDVTRSRPESESARTPAACPRHRSWRSSPAKKANTRVKQASRISAAALRISATGRPTVAQTRQKRCDTGIRTGAAPGSAVRCGGETPAGRTLQGRKKVRAADTRPSPQAPFATSGNPGICLDPENASTGSGSGCSGLHSEHAPLPSRDRRSGMNALASIQHFLPHPKHTAMLSCLWRYLGRLGGGGRHPQMVTAISPG